MNTPQSELYTISYKVNRMLQMFEMGDDDTCIFTDIKDIQEMQKKLTKCMEVMQDQQALIIKLLDKQ